VAAEAMRHILIDSARRKQTVRHGGGRRRVPLDDVPCVSASPDGLLALDDALTRFAAEEPAKAELVKLRFFAGMSIPEAAAWCLWSRRPQRGRCGAGFRTPPPCGR
jgi:hypothetical protein